MRLFLSTIFLFFSFLSVAQNDTSALVKGDSITKQTKAKKSRYIIFPGCENEDDKYECYANKLQDFIVNNLNNEAIQHLLRNAKNDTIVFYANIEYDKTGEKVLNKSRLLSFVKAFNPFLITIKYALPKVEPALNYKGEPKTTSVALTLGFQLEKRTNTIIPLYGYQPQLEQHQFKLLEVKEKIPVHPNCNQKADYETLKTCVNDNITSFVTKSFNYKLISETALPTGKYKIETSFKIDKNGRVIDIKVIGPNKILEEEAKRILKLLPKFVPGSLRDKPIVFPYSLPIIFEVTK